MSLSEVARIALPPHPPDGGFDHAAVDRQTARLYVAHTSNDAVDVIDLAGRRYVESLRNLRGVAGVWTAERPRRLFTSNRAEDSASIFDLDSGRELFRVPTGARPNGMAFEPKHGILMVAGVGNPALPDAPPTLSFVDIDDGREVARLRAPGRTRWGIYHPPTDAFYVNVADPPGIAVVAANDLNRIDRVIPIPAQGPHGLEQDPSGHRLLCACDDGTLISVEIPSGRADHVGVLAGPPDVLWLDPHLHHLYVAIGEPGVVDVFSVRPDQPVGTYRTGPGAHTLTLDPDRAELHVFLPETHEDLVLRES